MIIATKYKWVYVDENGTIYSTAKGEMRPLAPSRGGTGGKYLQVNVIHPDGVRRSTLVHKIMCEAWHGERPEPIDGHKFTVSHINGDRYDNRRDNLTWEPVQSNLVYLAAFVVGGAVPMWRTFYGMWAGDDPLYKWAKAATFTPFLWPMWLLLTFLNVGEAPLYGYEKYRRGGMR